MRKKNDEMMKLKHACFLLTLVVLQACASSKSTSVTADKAETETQSDSLTVHKSKTAEVAGIKVNGSVKTKSVITPEKKKK